MMRHPLAGLHGRWRRLCGLSALSLLAFGCTAPNLVAVERDAGASSDASIGGDGGSGPGDGVDGADGADDAALDAGGGDAALGDGAEGGTALITNAWLEAPVALAAPAGEAVQIELTLHVMRAAATSADQPLAVSVELSHGSLCAGSERPEVIIGDSVSFCIEHTRPTDALALDLRVSAQVGDREATAVVSLRMPAVRVVESGDAASCAVLENGALACWGLGTRSALAMPLGYGAVRATPSLTPFVDVLDVAMGDDHGCAIVADAAGSATDGSLRCWGRGEEGQLGGGSEDDSTSTAVLDHDSAVVQVATGAQHSCAIRSVGGTRSLACWGRNVEGELGGASGDVVATPHVVTLSGEPLRVVAGERHTCALIGSSGAATQGDVMCWGDDARGALGNDATLASSSTPVAVNLGGKQATQLYAGGEASCAVVEGSLLCWGAGHLTTGGSDAALPVPIGGLSGTIREVALGHSHACALVESGAGDASARRAYCWGITTTGAFGERAVRTLTTPTLIQGLPSRVDHVSVGHAPNGHHGTTCALAAGLVHCWGFNESGQAGTDAAVDDRATPQLATLVQAIAPQQLSVGAGWPATPCAIGADDAVYCWGDGWYGQLGQGKVETAALTHEPQQVKGLPSGEVAFVVSSGVGAMAIVDGELYRWGVTPLGSASAAVAVTPPVAGVVRDVDLSPTNGCIVVGDAPNAEVHCFGDGTFSKVDVASGDVRAVSVGYGYACAIVSGGVQCWGEDNRWQQLGTGDTTPHPTPVDVAAGGVDLGPEPVDASDQPYRFTAVATRDSRACALTEGGVLWCWGDDQGPAIALRDVAAVTGEAQNLCARKLDGTLWCEGGNEQGQRGTASAGEGFSRVEGLVAPVTAFSIGGAISAVACAVDAEGTKCWGRNTSRQRGAGPAYHVLQPTLVGAWSAE